MRRRVSVCSQHLKLSHRPMPSARTLPCRWMPRITGRTRARPRPTRLGNRQHPGIGIDQERDIISDKGTEVYSYLQHQGIAHLLIMGVHTNMCVLHRTFAIKQMVRWGVDVALIRDLTDAMYNPAMPPYVSHAEGTDLVVEFIEKFWCPSVESKDVLGD